MDPLTIMKAIGMASSTFGDTENTTGLPLGMLTNTVIGELFQSNDKSYTVPNTPVMAMGGEVMGKAKVEKGEIVDPPNGEAVEIGGGTHESGNDTTIVAPEGTDVFSDRIQIDGKSLAERKKTRDRRVKKLQNKMGKLSEKMDEEALDALKRGVNERNFEAVLADMLQELFEEESDKEVQEAVNQGQQVPEMAYGGTIKKYPYGTGTNGLFDLSFIPGVATPDPNAMGHRYTAGMGMGPTATQPAAAPVFDSLPPPDGAAGAGGDRLLNIWGEAGSLTNIFSPTAMTLLHRAGATSNPNYMQGFGAEGLRTQGKQFGTLAGSRDSRLRDIDRGVAGQRARNQSGSRSINTARALDMATTGQAQSMRGRVHADYGQQISQLFGQRAGMQNQVDSVRRQGAAQADISDRQDRGAFYTNLAKSLTTGATSSQHYGKQQDMAKAIETHGLDVLTDIFAMLK